MTGRERDPKVSFRLPEAMRDAVDDLAERFDVPRSALLRRFTSFGLESNAEALAVEAEIAKLRQEIIDFGKPIDDAGGFAGRVRRDFEKRFKNGYDAKWLVSKAENYRREARMLEEKVADHPDAPPIEDGELVAEVDRVLRNALEAVRLSDWGDRYQNPFEKYAGVESGKDGRQFALVLTRNALEMDRDMKPLASSLDTERRVRGDDLPELAEEDLPPTVDRDAVARVARDLADNGVTAEMVETDPTAFDPYGWTDDSEHVEADVTDPAELPGTETDGGESLVAVSDGGDHQALQAFTEDDAEADPGRDGEQDGGDQDDRDVGDLVEWAAEKLRESDPGDLSHYEEWKATEKRRKARENVEERIRRAFETDSPTWQTEIMDQSTLTPGDLIELADDYNDAVDDALAGDRENVPQAVADENGGVALE